ncbi:hypothetical protein TURU_001870 [Turdus rufiventris]|nr:hypothetical protein TURU_001870 [Turdus rufiventris]
MRKFRNFPRIRSCWERSDPKALLLDKKGFLGLESQEVQLGPNSNERNGNERSGKRFLLHPFGDLIFSGIYLDYQEEFQTFPDVLWP